ncbi:MAG: lipocalin family protein [Alphaproteobacteria bacterium]
MTRLSVRVVALALAAAAMGCAGGRDMPVVSGVDAARYAGRWHEIAQIPNRFQRECAGDTVAVYSPDSDGTIAVDNSCRRADGSREAAQGRARFTDQPGIGRLEVTFVSVFGYPLWLASGDYWIVALDPDYRWSVVGHPGRDYGWILSRSPEMPAATLRMLRGRLADVGYDTCRFVVTADPGRPRLCDI